MKTASLISAKLFKMKREEKKEKKRGIIPNIFV